MNRKEFIRYSILSSIALNLSATSCYVGSDQDEYEMLSISKILSENELIELGKVFSINNGLNLALIESKLLEYGINFDESNVKFKITEVSSAEFVKSEIEILKGWVLSKLECYLLAYVNEINN